MKHSNGVFFHERNTFLEKKQTHKEKKPQVMHDISKRWRQERSASHKHKHANTFDL